MANETTAGTPAPKAPPLVQAARTFMAGLKNDTIPEGLVKDAMDDKYHKAKGLRVVLRAIGEFIELKQETMSWGANEALVARLKGEDGVDLADMITDIATQPDDLSQRREELRKALIINGESVFDRIRLAVNNIRRDKGMQLDDNQAQAWGDPDPRDISRGPSEEKKDKGTWRESIHDVDKPKISDEEVRRGAKENDKTGGGVDEKGIQKSAQDGPKDFIPTDAHKTAYERSEDKGDLGYFREQAGEFQEIRAYTQLAQKLTREYKRAMEAQVAGRGGVGGPG